MDSPRSPRKRPSSGVRLCGSQGCCPEVVKGESEVVMTDDFGGQVRLTHEAWEDLRRKMAANEL